MSEEEGRINVVFIQTRPTSSVRDKVEEIKRELDRQVKIMKKKLDLIAALSEKTHPQKVNLMFQLWDVDSDGYISWKELAVGFRKFTSLVDVDASVADAADSAFNSLLAFDENDDQQLDRTEFEKFLERLCSSLGCTFDDVAEVLILEYSGTAPSEDEEVENLVLDAFEGEATLRVAVAQKFRKILSDERMVKLFKAFDRDSDGSIDFKELALGLEKFVPDQPLEDAAQAATNALLLFDDEGELRTLNYVQFVRFILTFTSIEGVTFDQVVDSLLKAAETPMDQSKQSALLTVAMEQAKEAERTLTTVMDVRLHAIFQLWDADHNGTISFKELTLGLKKFSPSKPIEELSAVATAMLLVHDEDENKELDALEFAEFINDYCSIAGYDFDELADFLVAFSQAEDKKDDVDFLDELQPRVNALLDEVNNEEEDDDS